MSTLGVRTAAPASPMCGVLLGCTACLAIVDAQRRDCYILVMPEAYRELYLAFVACVRRLAEVYQRPSSQRGLLTCNYYGSLVIFPHYGSNLAQLQLLGT